LVEQKEIPMESLLGAIAILFILFLFAWPLVFARIAIRGISRIDAHRIRKRLRDASPRELVEETDAEIERLWGFMKNYEGKALEGLSHEDRQLGRLREYRQQVIQIARELSLDVEGLEETNN